MIYVFLGNEINIIKKKIDSLVDELKIDNIIKYDYDSVSIEDILNEINYVDLFNEKKLLNKDFYTFDKILYNGNVYDIEKTEKLIKIGDSILKIKGNDIKVDTTFITI